jgi:hypothetical protein
MMQILETYPVKRTITREYDKEGRLLKETIQEFDTEKKNTPEGGGAGSGCPWCAPSPYQPWYPWPPCQPDGGIKITYSGEKVKEGGYGGGA